MILREINFLTLINRQSSYRHHGAMLSHYNNEGINIEQANEASSKVCAINRRMQNLISGQAFCN